MSEVSYIIQERVDDPVIWNNDEPAILGFDGTDFEFMSNFVWCTVQLDGQFYPTTEHAYQAAKTFDLDNRRLICIAKTPGISKRLGQKCKMRDDWDRVKEDVMYDLLVQKFSQPEFAEKLLATGMRYLEETNHWGDRYWGVDGTGKNRLGMLLMKIRSELREIMQTADR